MCTNGHLTSWPRRPSAVLQRGRSRTRRRRTRRSTRSGTTCSSSSDRAASGPDARLGSEPPVRDRVAQRRLLQPARNQPIDFEVVLHENGQILPQYAQRRPRRQEQGNSATLGIENAAGNDGLQYSFNEPSIEAQLRDPLSAAAVGIVQGNVTDVNDGLAALGRHGQARPGRQRQVRQTTHRRNGFYRMQVPVGTYADRGQQDRLRDPAEDVTVTEDQTVATDFALRTPRARRSRRRRLRWSLPPNQTRTRTLTLTNTGGCAIDCRHPGGRRTASDTVDRSAGLAEGRRASTRRPHDERPLQSAARSPAGRSDAPGDVIGPCRRAARARLGRRLHRQRLALGRRRGSCATSSEAVTRRTGPTGVSWDAPWAGAWPGDMAFDANGRAVPGQRRRSTTASTAGTGTRAA